MGASKFVYFGTTKFDITDTTASVDGVESGMTFYDASGTKQTGTLEYRTVYIGTSAPSSSTGVVGDIYVQLPG